MTEACLPACLLSGGVWDICILCGEMIMTVHWTDQLIRDADHRSRKKIVAGEGQRERMRLRPRRVAIANQILSYYGLALKDWDGSKYMLSDKKGTSVVTNDLGGMWKAASDLAYQDSDPFDLAFLKAFQERM